MKDSEFDLKVAIKQQALADELATSAAQAESEGHPSIAKQNFDQALSVEEHADGVLARGAKTERKGN